MDDPRDEHEFEHHDTRIAVQLRARISTIDPETDPLTGKPFFRTCDETCANVSRGGVFVSTRESIPAGRRVLVELEIPGGRLIQTVGRVAWARVTLPSEAADAPAGTTSETPEPGIGIEFVAGAREERIALERFVARSIRRRKRDRDPNPAWATID
jgi:Tfp pilus assembly protein PilZ